jgi:hypothetical protein
MVAAVATRKITITLPEETLEGVAKLARAQGVPLSTYIAGMAEHRVRVEDGLAAMREWELEHGPPSHEAQQWLAEQLSRLVGESAVLGKEAC